VEGQTLNFHDVEASITGADYRVLLMSLFHMTGDERWLESPFRPRRDVRLVADLHAGLPSDVRAQIREAAVNHLFEHGQSVCVTDPGEDLMLRMMSTCLGEDVPIEYARMFREDMGFTSDALPDKATEIETIALDVLIVGAGVSGMALAAALEHSGVPYTLIDRNSSLGGTWYENTYPGCGVDTPSHAYSFRGNGRNRWARYFALGGEVREYLDRCGKDFEIIDHIRLNTELVSAHWNEHQRRWDVEVRAADGRRELLSASILVSAVGIFNAPATPSISGLCDFQGDIAHTARWPEGLQVAGRTVAVIGTGASAMQLVPAIAKDVRRLTVFQRSPQWIRPIEGYRDDLPEGTHWLFEHVPYYAEWFRLTMFWRYGDGLLPALRKDPSWPHPERSVNRRNDQHREELTNYIRGQLARRPEYIEQCTPTYPPYGKRILLDSGWFQALVASHTVLVSENIDHVVGKGIVTASGAFYEADLIVLATGFDVFRLAASMDIIGHGGERLAEAWADQNPTAYLGITVPSFPNFFCMLGPNTGLGHGGSAIFQAECQARYIVSCLRQMSSLGLKSITVKRRIHDEYVRRVDAEHEGLVWTHPGMTTYYRNPQGRVVTVMPWRIVDYWAMTHDANLDEFDVEQSFE
jgi:4-hydroxyacetophenone monooxygenase